MGATVLCLCSYVTPVSQSDQNVCDGTRVREGRGKQRNRLVIRNGNAKLMTDATGTGMLRLGF